MKSNRNACWPLVLLLALACSPPPAETYEPASTRVRTTPVDESSEDFFAAPWPDDRRLDADGRIPLEEFPNPGNGWGFSEVLRTGHSALAGWGLSAPIYVPLTGAIDLESLPQNPAASLESDSSLYLVAVDAASPADGRRVPIDWHFYEEPTLFLPGNVLAVRPVPGFPMEPKTRYVLVLTTDVKDAGGEALGPEKELWRVLLSQSDAANRRHYAPLLTLLERTGMDASRVAGAVVFKTQAILDELIAIRDHVLAQPAPGIENLVKVVEYSNFVLYEGTYKAPNFQHGRPPYLPDGGEFRFDAAGAPIPAVVEDMRVSIGVPKGAAPEGGFPAVFYSHGTGGDYMSGIGDIAYDLAAEGIATFGIDQVLHGPRVPEGEKCFAGQDPEVCFFNVLNAPAGRTTIRQAAIDHFALRKMAGALVIPAGLRGGDAAGFDLSKVAYFGHSQGGLSGAVYAAIDPALDAAVISGAGAHLSTTLMERDDILDFKSLLEGPLFLGISPGEKLDFFHPALALMQTLGEAADPMNYARYWVNRPEGKAKNIYLTSGLEDPNTGANTAEYLAAAAGIPQLLPVGREAAVMDLAGLVPVEAPLSGNIQTPAGNVTAVFRQFPGEGHFPVFYNPSARNQWRAFFRSLFKGGEVTVPAN